MESIRVGKLAYIVDLLASLVARPYLLVSWKTEISVFKIVGWIVLPKDSLYQRAFVKSVISVLFYNTRQMS